MPTDTKAKPWPKKTRLTKRGEPYEGTVIEVELKDGTWERVLVVAKGWNHADELVGIAFEFSDGARTRLVAEDSINWRPVHG